MLDRKQRRIALAVTVVLFGLNLVAFNYLISGWSGARLDLTEEGVFSISPATERILGALEENVTIHGFFSGRTHPKLSPLVPQIIDLLDEYRAVSGGRVVVEIVDPGENEAAEEEAADRFGVRSTPFQLASKYETGIVNAYFALVVQFGDQYVRYGFQDLIEVEMLADGDIDVRLRNLEYDLTRAIKKTVFGFRSASELFERVEGEVRLTGVLSPASLPEIFSEVPDALRSAAAELTEKGAGKFVYEEVDPTLDDAARQELEMRWSVQPMSLGFVDDRSFYLYGLLEVGDQVEQLMLARDELTAAEIRETVENSLRRHTPGFLKTVGVVTPAPPEIPPQLRAQMGMPPTAPPEYQEVKRFLEQDYQIKDVRLDDAAGVPSDIDVLLVLKPKELDDEQIYRLDQFLMRGGRIVLAAGNYEATVGQQGLTVSPVNTGLDDWLAHHGVTIAKALVLDDRNQSLPIPETRYTALGALRTWTLAPYPYLVQVRDEGFLNRDITATLDAVGIYWGSPITLAENPPEGLEALPILQSSSLSWTDDDLANTAFVDYTVPEEGTEPHLLSVALSGRFRSFYADKLPPGEDAESDADTTPTEPRVSLGTSPETRLVIVANGEFLNDFVAQSLGQLDGGFFVENLRFIENVIDWTGLDNEMIGIRARGLASRHLERVDRRTEVALEVVNYAIPVILLMGLGGYLYWQRRHAAPILDGGGKTVPASRVTRKGA